MYVAGTPAYTLRAFAYREGERDARVNAGGDPPSAPAFQVLAGLAYRATLLLAPGTRNLRTGEGARRAGLAAGTSLEPTRFPGVWR